MYCTGGSAQSSGQGCATRLTHRPPTLCAHLYDCHVVARSIYRPLHPLRFISAPPHPCPLFITTCAYIRHTSTPDPLLYLSIPHRRVLCPVPHALSPCRTSRRPRSSSTRVSTVQQARHPLVARPHLRLPHRLTSRHSRSPHDGQGVLRVRGAVRVCEGGLGVAKGVCAFASPLDLGYRTSDVHLEIAPWCARVRLAAHQEGRRETRCCTRRVGEWRDVAEEGERCVRLLNLSVLAEGPLFISMIPVPCVCALQRSRVGSVLRRVPLAAVNGGRRGASSSRRRRAVCSISTWT